MSTSNKIGDLVLGYSFEGEPNLGIIKKVPDWEHYDYTIEWQNGLTTIATIPDFERYKKNLRIYYARQTRGW